MEYKKCQYCAEEVLSEAIKCKHCASMLNGEQISTNININSINPFAAFNTQIIKNTGKITIIGYIGIILGILMICVGFIDQPFLIGFGVFMTIGCYMWARKTI